MEQSRDGQIPATRTLHSSQPDRVFSSRHFWTNRLASCVLGLVAATFTLVVRRCYADDLEVSGSWGCEMSWMTPWYRKLEWHDSPSSRYSLYLYREQGWDTESFLDGHPVIFVPGNAGSYQQVRSIASSASRQFYQQPGLKAEGMEKVNKLDFFTLDLKEDFSAFHARTLDDQALYIRHSIRRVLDEYQHLENEQRPVQVTLLAHSMGGIAARLAVDSNVSEFVDVIVTMSTPHLLPPLTLEKRMDDIYSVIETRYHDGTTPPLISLCGGISDTQVVSDSCALPGREALHSNDLAVFTTGVSGAWTGVDHQAMVWCHQVRWRVARMMLAMTEWTDPAEKASAAFDILLGYGTSKAASRTMSLKQTIPISSNNMSILWSSASLHIESCDRSGSCQKLPFSYHHIPWPKFPAAPFPLPGEGITADEVVNSMDIDLPKPHTRLLLYSDQDVVIAVGERRIKQVDGLTWTRDASEPHAAHQILQFPQLASTALNVYRLSITSRQCRGSRPIIKHSAPVSPILARTTFESRYYTADPSAVIRLHSHTNAAPFMPFLAGPSGLRLDIFQTSDCPIDHITIQTDYAGMIAKVVTRYRMTAIAWTVGWAGLALLYQIRHFEQSGEMHGLGEAIEQLARRWFIASLGILYAGAVIQCLLYPVPSARRLLFGTTQLDALPLVGICAICTFGVLALLWSVLKCGAYLLSKTYRQPANNPPSSPLEVRSVRWTFQLAVLVALTYLLIPHQLVFVSSLTFLYAKWVRNGFRGQTDNLSTILPSLIVFMTTLLPFKGPGLFVWMRNTWFDWEYALNMERDLAHVSSIICLVALFNQGPTLKRSHRLLRICQVTLALFSTAAFAVGGRYTWLLDVLSDTVLLSMALTML